MPIIMLKQGTETVRVQAKPFEKEDELQQYVAGHPESLPVDEIEDGLQLLVLSREFPVGTGQIDVFAVDGNGVPYVIETKLYKNSDKRHVVAQVLDYGAALWNDYTDFDAFHRDLDASVQKWSGEGLDQRVSDFFGFDGADLGRFYEQMRECLSEGALRFLVLMDHITDALKVLIRYLNAKSEFSLYGVELEYYRHEELEIMVPRLYGAEVRKEAASISNRRNWNEKTFFAEVAERLAPEHREAVRRLYEFSRDSADEIGWGKGTQRGGFSPKWTRLYPKSLYTAYVDGDLELHFHWLGDCPRLHEGLAEASKALDHDLPENYEKRHVNVPADGWAGQVQEFISAIGALVSSDGQG